MKVGAPEREGGEDIRLEQSRGWGGRKRKERGNKAIRARYWEQLMGMYVHRYIDTYVHKVVFIVYIKGRVGRLVDCGGVRRSFAARERTRVRVEKGGRE